MVAARCFATLEVVLLAESIFLFLATAERSSGESLVKLLQGRNLCVKTPVESFSLA